MSESREPQSYVGSATNIGQQVYARKFSAGFSIEMTRSVRKAIHTWVGACEG